MIIGVGLPMKSLDEEKLVAFAQHVEAGPFASISLGERLNFECHDLMIALTYIAAKTSTLLMRTSVLCLPMHREGVVAKQSATLDRLSKGRFSLGIGLGGRPGDFAVAPAEWAGRGAKMERQIATVRRIWSGLAPFDGTDPVGPTPFTPGGPELIIGGTAIPALKRAGRLADGLRSFSFSADVDEHMSRHAVVQQAWNEAGRPGKPRLIAAANFALGPGARAAYEEHVNKYYGYDPNLVATATTSRAPTNATSVSDYIKRARDAGIDELVFTALTSDTFDSIDALAELVADIDLT